MLIAYFIYMPFFFFSPPPPTPTPTPTPFFQIHAYCNSFFNDHLILLKWVKTNISHVLTNQNKPISFSKNNIHFIYTSKNFKLFSNQSYTVQVTYIPFAYKDLKRAEIYYPTCIWTFVGVFLYLYFHIILLLTPN